MIFLQFQAHLANEAGSVVSYKAFGQDNADVYPTFTICLVGDRGKIFKDTVCAYPCSNATYRKNRKNDCAYYCENYNFQWRMQTSLRKM